MGSIKDRSARCLKKRLQESTKVEDLRTRVTPILKRTSNSDGRVDESGVDISVLAALRSLATSSDSCS